MKNKTQNRELFFIMLLACLFFGGVFVSRVFALTLEEQCVASGGKFGSTTNRCTECPAGKVTGAGQGAVCQTQADYDASVSSANPAVDAHPEIVAGAGSIYATSTTTQPSTKQFNYKLLGSFPGFFSAGQTMNDFPALIIAIYKFGIWTVGIAGLFMLVVGGFMYMASAGNTSTAGNARGIIWDSLLGIVAALGAYLILYVINPDLTKINLNFTPVEVTEGTPMGPAGICKPATTAECSVSALTPVFGAKATEASSICNGESEGKSVPSGVDICADGKPASWGLFQINITVHKIGGFDCPSAFSGGAYTSTNHNCRVKGDAASLATYQNCITAAKNASTNIALAKSLYVGAKNSWGQWGANERSKCFFH
ncbi:MAG: hypothetical protein HGA36_00010 [Candidatus Moranbacteria bacterium]|nr:hypothetical protein [Candidatus Moranbacteria bacterium]